MFDRLERALGSIGVHLPANLTAAQRKLVLVFGGFAFLFGLNALVGTALAILIAVVAAVALAARARSIGAGTTATAHRTLGLRQRPAPRVLFAYLPSLRPLDVLMDGVPPADRPATLVAVLDTVELLATTPDMVGIDADELRRLHAAGDLPRMTPAACRLFGAGAIIVPQSRVASAEGLHLAAVLDHPAKRNVRIAWTVLAAPGAPCAYRIDAITLI